MLDKISPGSVNWRHASKPPIKLPFRKVENCNQVVRIGKGLKFSLVNVAGHDIMQGNKKLILGMYGSYYSLLNNIYCSFFLDHPPWLNLSFMAYAYFSSRHKSQICTAWQSLSLVLRKSWRFLILILSLSAYLWQLMRFNILQLLKNLRSHSEGKEVTDADILDWANDRVRRTGRTSRMESFRVKLISASTRLSGKISI